MKTFTLLSLSALTAISLMADSAYYYSGGQKHMLSEDKQKRVEDGSGAKYYKHENGSSVGVTDGVLAKFKDGVDIDAIINKYSLTLVKKLDNGIYLFQSANSLSVSAQMVESGEAEFAHPDMIVQKKARNYIPKDPFFSSQEWHLLNTGQNGGKKGADINATYAWDITKGKGAKVAIYDDGIDTGHEDLKEAVIAQYDFDKKIASAMPVASDENHGTSVAGLALARENSVGGVGVAPEAGMIAIKQFNGTISNLVAAFNYAKNQGADVVNCSWGTGAPTDAEVAAINDITTNGRGGKGTVVVFAAPNDNADLGTDESSLPNVIGVGASTNQDVRAYYSSYGDKLAVVAPSGGGTLNLFTTDRTGSAGYATTASGHPNYDYATDNTGFAGCSGSAPIVAGVAALVIAANPNLTRQQVTDIITGTADKIGSTTYTNGKNKYYGYGRINAGAAVAKAKSMLSGGTTTTTTGGATTGGGSSTTGGGTTTTGGTANGGGSSATGGTSTSTTTPPAQPAQPTTTYSYAFYKGWQMFSPPFNGNEAYSGVVDGHKILGAYEYDSARGALVFPSEFKSGKGYWVYSSQNFSLQMKPTSTNSSSFNTSSWFATLSKGVSLAGVPVDVNSADLVNAGVKQILAYSIQTNSYSSPTVLKAGTAFWLVK